MTAFVSRLQDPVPLCLFAPDSPLSTLAHPILISALGACMSLPASLTLSHPLSCFLPCLHLSLVVCVPGTNWSLAAVTAAAPTPRLRGPSSYNPPADIWPKPLSSQFSWNKIGIFQPNIPEKRRRGCGGTGNKSRHRNRPRNSTCLTQVPHRRGDTDPGDRHSWVPRRLEKGEWTQQSCWVLERSAVHPAH